MFYWKRFPGPVDVLNVWSLFTTTYHPQTNVQTEGHKWTILYSLRHYIEDHPRYWDLYCRTVTYAYNYQPHIYDNGTAPTCFSQPTQPSDCEERTF